jgi:hypothetical protein
MNRRTSTSSASAHGQILACTCAFANSGGFSSVKLNRIQRLIAANRETLLENGMNSLAIEPRTTFAENVRVTSESLSVELSDGRSVTAPLAWFPRLQHGTAKERNSWRLIGRGEGIHWPDLDEDISVEGLMLGKPSGESQQSFQRWLEKRGKHGRK